MVSATLPLSGVRRISDLAAALELFAALRDQQVEMLAFAYLDPKRRLLGMRHRTTGRPDAAEVPVRDIVADAIALDAAAVVMAHNHPGGDPTPSAADRAATRRLTRALDTIEVRLVDHVVLAAGGSASFREMGLL